MPTLSITVAGIPLSLECRHVATEVRLADFRTPAAADAIHIRVTPADLAYEQDLLGRIMSDGYLESLALERAAARALAPMGVAHMHAVALAVTTDNGREACVFLADSGVGKSTHVHHWLQLFGDRALVVADDKPFFSFQEDKLLVHGSPWKGREGWGENMSVPVRCFCILQRGGENMARRADSSEAMQELFRRIFLPEDPDGAVAVLNFADKVLSAVPFWCLFCTDSPEAATVAYTVMVEKGVNSQL